MASALIGAAFSVVGKALAPVTDTVLEAWAATKDLGPNIEALKMELLYVEAMLKPYQGQEIDNSALEALMRKLCDLAYDADDVLDELDYFRIQDELDDTSEAAHKHPKGCGHNLILNVRHTAKAVRKLLWVPACCSSAATPGASSPLRTNHANGQVNGCMSKLSLGVPNTISAVGKSLPCSSLPHVRDDNHGQSDMLGLRGACAMHNSPQQQKLRFNRVGISTRIKNIAVTMRTVRKDVSEILRTIGSSQNNAQHDVPSRRITISESTEPELRGRKHTMDSIIHDITVGLYSDKELMVLPIVGPGGIGKTTLTQYIYHNKDVQKHFDVKVWTYVSLNFNVNKLIEGIEKDTRGKDDDETIGTAAERIGQRFKFRRFLLVLDDMWECSDEDEWKRLLLPFRKSQETGNIIIVTTRFPAIARMVKTSDQSIELEGLDRKEFKKLFLSFVFGTEQPRLDHIVLLETGDKILDKLKGNPLAAKTVGRLLRNHLDLNMWERVLQNKEWESEKGNHNIMPALKLSYDYLPFHLQQCFSYCALFPKDYKFDSTELIYFWIALDILNPSGQHKAIEDTGLDSLNHLVSYGFFKKEESYRGRTFYIIHDLLHDLALKVAHECLSIDRSNVRSLQIRASVRHLSIIVDHAGGSDQIKDEDFLSELKILKTGLKIETLQTIMIYGSYECFADFFGDLLKKVNSLRILHMDDKSMLQNHPIFPHLRYLRLEHIGAEIHLPSMLYGLYHLRILDLRAWYGCPDLLRDISSLTKLRHIVSYTDCHHSEIRNVGKLHFLQELKKFEVNKESYGFDLKQLRNLVELRELGIYGLEKIQTKEAADEAKLRDKKHLLKLTLNWCHGHPENESDVKGEILEGLEPARILQNLCIEGHGSHSCPTWLGSQLSVKALQSLDLDDLMWEDLPALEQMGLLYELTLKNMPALKEFGRLRNCSSIIGQSFCSLKRLTLICLGGLEKWVTGDRCLLFYLLEELIIRDCPNLMALPFADPASQGEEGKLNCFANLRVLEIDNCPKVVSLPPIPWTQTLRSVMIETTGTSAENSLNYQKSEENVSLKICGNGESVLVCNNLTDLQELEVKIWPSMQFKDLQMLTSLKSLHIENSAFVLSKSEGKVKWQIPVERLHVLNSCVTGKELTQLLSHLPKLSNFIISDCEKITQMGVAGQQQQLTAHIPAPSASDVRIEDAHATYEQQETTEEAEETEKRDDGSLLLPAHLSDSLQRLEIIDCKELSLLVACPPLPPDGGGCKTRKGGEGGGLHALRSLEELYIDGCPRLYDAYKTSSSFTCFLFPPSLRKLMFRNANGIWTPEPISNLTNLTKLYLRCGDDLRGDGLWPLVTSGHLSELIVLGSPRGLRALQDEHQELLGHSCKLRELRTDSVTEFLAVPICTILSSSLTKLTLYGFRMKEVRFTKEQQDALQLLTSLQDLNFSSFYQLQCLPTCLPTLFNLKRLKILGCQLISSLPEDGLPVSLQELDVQNCGNEELKQQCRNFILNHPSIKLIGNCKGSIQLWDQKLSTTLPNISASTTYSQSMSGPWQRSIRRTSASAQARISARRRLTAAPWGVGGPLGGSGA